MRRTFMLSSAVLIAAASCAEPVAAGDRYGPPEPVKPVTVSATDWSGPLLGWNNKAAPEAAAAATSSAKPPVVRPSAPPPPFLAQPVPPLTSIYTPAPAPVAAAATPTPTAHQPARPAGEVLTLSLADLPPPGPSLERQQAAEEDAAVLAAKIARADAQAAKDIAAGRPVTGGNTALLGGP